MKSDYFEGLSSFSNEIYSKGLITFYEEQWNENLQKNVNNEKDENTCNDEEKVHYKKIRKELPLRELTNVSNKDSKEITKFKTESRKCIFRYKKTHHEMKKEKENKALKIEQNTLEKPFFKLKEVKAFEPVRIRMFPLGNNESIENGISKIFAEIPSLRIRKGSSFKGFHRENFSISTVGLSQNILMECHKKVDKSFNELEKKSIHIGEFIFNREKPVSNYLFPVQNSDCEFFRKVNEKKIEEYEDSLNKFCRKLSNRRQLRNTSVNSVIRDNHS